MDIERSGEKYILPIDIPSKVESWSGAGNENPPNTGIVFII